MKQNSKSSVIVLLALPAILSLSVKANADCDHPESREEIRTCLAGSTELKATNFFCKITSGPDVLLTVKVKAFDRRGAEIRTAIENVSIADDGSATLKQDSSNAQSDTLMGPWSETVTDVKCVQVK